MNKEEHWDLEIKPKAGLLEVDFKELFAYRNLLVLFIKRDLSTVYKQTVLGPLWYVIQPLFTTIVFSVIFNNIAGIKTGTVPPFLFYLAGTCLWTYFNDSLLSTSRAFTDNSGIFGKVYFPRLVLPLSRVLSGFIKFLVQLGLFLVVYAYFIIFTDVALKPNWQLVFIPLVLLLLLLLGLGFGLIISSLTTKYRDLQHLLGFGMQLAMYASPVVYPMFKVSDKWYGKYLWLNPMSSFLELFRYGFFGDYAVNLWYLVYSSVFTVIILGLGIIMFNKHEKSFMDTV